MVREAFDIMTGDLYCCKSIPRENLSAEMFADIKLEAGEQSVCAHSLPIRRVIAAQHDVQ